ncbi:hypothetical protein F442_02551 [Phytophthora nicotianae P10297]|uniref:Uncharacterized protein n=1 Tax=Phytophthora nicotianae P10297 TaxID=1317064 RepID=W3A1M6_PHYNI|nr:hypothetical protein F442_02551 [Phytophthora nicotianae P10297]
MIRDLVLNFLTSCTRRYGQDLALPVTTEEFKPGGPINHHDYQAAICY